MNDQAESVTSSRVLRHRGWRESVDGLAPVALFLGVMLPTSFAHGADALAGKTTFREQCALCHTAQQGDNGGAQGPSLRDVFGRPAADSGDYSYTQALRASGLTWDEAALDRFLASPGTVVAGSTMVVALPKPGDRANVIAYFQALKNGTFTEPPPPAGFGPPPGPPPGAAAPTGEADWKKDAPGRVHHIKAGSLPPPMATPIAVNFPRLVERPADARLALPPGFKAEVFARGLNGPRLIRVAPNGDSFVSETRSGRVMVLRPSTDGATAAIVQPFAQGLNQPFGMAFYPSGADPKWLYVAEINRVVRYAYRSGELVASGVPEVVVPELSPASGGHFTRDIVFSPNGKRMFISVGSLSNAAEDMPQKSPAEIKEWEAKHGLGAAWGNEENRAAVLVFHVGSSKPGRIYATGIRNCVGLTIQPKTGSLWCTANERDGLGDDLVPDYSTRLKQGGFYGWPWYYMGSNEDPRHKGRRPDLRGKAIVPDVLYQAHSAADTMVFYPANSGTSAFPAEYVDDAFVVMHGSWNRAFRTGHKIVRVRMKNNKPTGQYEDFMTGFIVDDGNAWGRPVAAAVAKDGSLLMTDDDAGSLVYRISYSK